MQFFQIIFLLFVANIIKILLQYCQKVIILTLTLKTENLTVDSALHLITSILYPVITNVINELNDFMTIAITNKYEKQVSLSFASDADRLSSIRNLLATILSHQSPIHYIFLTEWADRINVELNTNSLDSKIEDSFTEFSDINISYMNDYSVLITCFSNDTVIVSCNINLFKQMQVSCMNQVEGLICFNPASFILNDSAPCFFAACVKAVYTYSKDDKVNVSNLKSNLISCCIDSFCEAFLRQKKRRD